MFCSVQECNRDVWSKGMCVAHYFRMRRHGDPLADVPIRGAADPARCAVETCITEVYARRLCEKHYRRFLRTGETERTRPTERETCSVPDCDRSTDARGLCHGHYQRWKRHGDVRATEPLTRWKNGGLCFVEGCGRPVRKGGLCDTHYKRLRRTGGIRADVPIRTRKPEGSLNGGGYRNVRVPAEHLHLTNGETTVTEHRLVMAIHLGRPLLPGEVVHHRNGQRIDNRIENLELLNAAHPKGQSIDDKIAHALDVLESYLPIALSEDFRPLSGDIAKDGSGGE